MIKNYRFKNSDEVVLLGTAKDLTKYRGEKAIVVALLPIDHLNDYIVELEAGGRMRLREREIAPIENKELLNIKLGQKVIHAPTNEKAEVYKIDYLYGHVGLKFQDGSTATVGIEAIKKNTRKSWDQYFMDIASMVATRATCDRLHVGCVIAKDKRIISTGYNGSPSGQPHCDDVGHLYNDQKRCIRTIHAEQNAILYSNREDLEGATAYVTHQPCENCAKLLVQSGVKRIVFKEKYSNKHSDFFLNMVDRKHLEG